MPDPLYIFGMDEVVASFPYDVYRGQIHVITNSTKRRTQAGTQEENGERDCQITLDTDLLTHFHHARYPGGYGTGFFKTRKCAG